MSLCINHHLLPFPQKVSLVKTGVCNNLFIAFIFMSTWQFILLSIWQNNCTSFFKVGQRDGSLEKITCCRAWPKFKSWDQLDEWRKLTHTNCTLTSTCTPVHTQLNKHSKAFLSLTLMIKMVTGRKYTCLPVYLRTIKYLMATHILHRTSEIITGQKGCEAIETNIRSGIRYRQNFLTTGLEHKFPKGSHNPIGHSAMSWDAFQCQTTVARSASGPWLVEARKLQMVYSAQDRASREESGSENQEFHSSEALPLKCHLTLISKLFVQSWIGAFGNWFMLSG